MYAVVSRGATNIDRPGEAPSTRLCVERAATPPPCFFFVVVAGVTRIFQVEVELKSKGWC